MWKCRKVIGVVLVVCLLMVNTSTFYAYVKNGYVLSSNKSAKVWGNCTWGYAHTRIRSLPNINGNMASGFTFSKIKITEIYQDKSDEYKVGDEITILENEVYDEANDIVYHIGGYNMMIVGDEYLLFLHHAQTNGNDYFVASGVDCGTISLKTDERQKTYTTREGNHVVDFSVYQEIWNDALDKYIN